MLQYVTIKFSGTLTANEFENPHRCGSVDQTDYEYNVVIKCNKIGLNKWTGWLANSSIDQMREALQNDLVVPSGELFAIALTNKLDEFFASKGVFCRLVEVEVRGGEKHTFSSQKKRWWA